MIACSVQAGVADSLALIDAPEPSPSAGALLVKTLAIGVCGTDHEIIAGHYGRPVAGQTDLIIGHESVGQVIDAPPTTNFRAGDLLCGIVRRPDPVPCRNCANGEWDMCRNGLYRERGIKELHGFASERFRIEPEFAVPVNTALGELGVLVEPASVIAKVFDHAWRLGGRSSAWRPRRLLVTGAGPIGLLAVLFGRARGLDVSVFDRVTLGSKPSLVRDIGAVYYAGSLPNLEEHAPDLIVECTGAPSVVADVVTRSAPAGVVCLAGLSSGQHIVKLDMGAISRELVLENDIVFGSVSANRAHYETAVEILSSAERPWLAQIISRRVPLNRWREAFERRPDDIKVVLEFGGIA